MSNHPSGRAVTKRRPEASPAAGGLAWLVVQPVAETVAPAVEDRLHPVALDGEPVTAPRVDIAGVVRPQSLREERDLAMLGDDERRRRTPGRERRCEAGQVGQSEKM